MLFSTATWSLVPPDFLFTGNLGEAQGPAEGSVLPPETFLQCPVKPLLSLLLVNGEVVVEQAGFSRVSLWQANAA